MCSNIQEEEEDMDNYQGDLTDIVRAVAGDPLPSDWQFPTVNNIFDQEPIRLDGFGNPFSNMQDPLLHDLLHTTTTTLSSCSSSLSLSSSSSSSISAAVAAPSFFVPAATSKEIITSPATAATGAAQPCSNRFSQMLHISKLAVSPPAMPNINTPSSLPPQNSSSHLQISSPRNPGVKRRKSQAKKVVCIPAPACVNSRPTGEIVPSDLWAWRKYGQKPIKGSPYPRGYYRCSSSKGCSARKQVERSRTDPNMLVITYTSEHNHPWPTQRNALAGSTRSQPSKANSSNPNKTPTTTTTTTSTNTKLEQQQHGQESSNNNNIVVNNDTTTSDNSPSNNNNNNINAVASVKEEIQDSYRPVMPVSSNQLIISDNNDQDSFFSELGEIEADPLHLLFTQSFNEDDEEHKDHIFDWSQDNNKGL